MKLIYFSGVKNEVLFPILTGHYQCPSLNSYGPHVRTYHIIHFVIKGKGTLFNDRGAHPVETGEMFIIREGEQTTYVADKDEPWEYVWLGFSGQRTSLFDSLDDVLRVPAELDMKLFEYVKRGVRSPDIYLSILYELIYHLTGASYGESSDERISEVHDYIKYNYTESITIAGLASTFGFERSYLYRVFKQKYGVGPKEYLTRVRLDKARWLLSRGYSVSESSYMVGYPDAFSFSKAYKKRYGTAPSLDTQEQQDNVPPPNGQPTF